MAKVFPWAAAKFVYNLLTSHTLRANLLKKGAILSSVSIHIV